MADILYPLHVALQVSDLDKAEQFYTEILGLTKGERNLTFPGTWYQIGDFQLHLIVSEWAKNPAREDKWGRHPHITFAIHDLNAVKQALSARAVPFQMSSSGRAALFVKDPDGNVVELLEISAD
ncbi:MAG: putative dioxygenase of extradiol dioxygenase family [Phormidesmis priestleyi Ana]|uniref:Putative dioxygenase of extradiol dioxygenase family n=1 Tax=Phormidesmis priestleyi Ana TaxID=1666911 RepID=A0A0P7ZLK6_9CYAN|nr:MAG: putative dioxygenase of extradiol dioxygenase family [Phormidesmis priestleyi Ana]